jgi:hypothetical protein
VCLHRALLAPALTAILAVLIPLAYASPPDPTWIAGIYSDADYDDAVVALVSVAGVLQAGRVEPFAARRSGIRLSASSETPPAIAVEKHKSDRAPPLG